MRDGQSPEAAAVDGPMTVPLRGTPVRFRWWLFGCLVVLGAGFAVLHAFAPGPDLADIVREPGALLLLALILLADFYPTLPWMRDANPFDEFIFSTPLAIAALMVYGPHAAMVFVIAGLAMTLALRMRWWRVVLNTALWGVQGLAAAGVLAVIWHLLSWTDGVPGWALLPITVVMFLLSPRVGRLSMRFGPRLFMGVGPLLAGVSLVWLTQLDPGFSYWTELLPILIGFSLGLSLTVAPLTATVLADASERDAGIASGVNNAVARIAGLLGIAVVGAIVAGSQNTLDLAGFHVSMAITAALITGGGVIGLAGIRKAT